MDISFRCDCGKQLWAAEDSAGQRMRCSECGREIVVPANLARTDPVRLKQGIVDRLLGLGVLSFLCGALSLCLWLLVVLLRPSMEQSDKEVFHLIGAGLFYSSPLFAFLALLLGFLEVWSFQWGLLRPRALPAAGLLMGLASGALFVYDIHRMYEASLVPYARANNLSQIGLAMQTYDKDHNQLPPAAITSADGRPLLSWRVALLPYLEEQELYNQFHLDEPWDSPHNRLLLDRMPAVYASPGVDEGKTNLTYFQVFVGPGTPFEPGQRVQLDDKSFPDGLGKTILAVEAGEGIPWTKPADLTYDRNQPLPRLGHGRKTYYAVMGNRDVRRLKKDLDANTLRVLIERNHGQRLDIDVE